MMQYIPKKNPDLNNNDNLQNQGIKMESKEEEKNKKIPAILFPTPIFYNPLLKNNMICKYQKKKTKPFTERQGDWICRYCKNLNFAFRNECNRCGLKKKKCMEIVKQNEENENKNKIPDKKIYKNKKICSNYINNTNYNQNQKHNDYNMNDKSLEE